jgi:hypothetical protein
VDGIDDLAAVDPFEVDAGDPEIGVAKLPLDDDQRDALAGDLDCVCMPELVRRKAPADPSGRREVAERGSSSG